jgi:hypothetical protein
VSALASMAVVSAKAGSQLGYLRIH